MVDLVVPESGDEAQDKFGPGFDLVVDMDGMNDHLVVDMIDHLWLLTWSFPRAEMKHKMNPVMDAQLNRNRQRQRGHRRNLSDGRISSATEHLGEDVSTHGGVSIVVLFTYVLLDWRLLEPTRTALL